MSRVRAALILLAVVVVAMAVVANDKPKEDYQKAMTANGKAMQDVRAAAKEIEESGAGFQDYEPFIEAAATLKESFATALDYWQAKKVDDAVKWSQEAAQAVTDLEAGAKNRNYRDVLLAINTLNATCTACHAAHRERAADGGYEIK